MGVLVQPPDKPGTGECALDPSIFGASVRLLNANHFNVYYKGMPQSQGKVSVDTSSSVLRLGVRHENCLGKVVLIRRTLRMGQFSLVTLNLSGFRL